MKSSQVPSVKRPFTVFDGMLLVAFAALGMAVSRQVHPTLPTMFFFSRAIYQGFPILTALTFGLLVVSIRRPGSALDRGFMRLGIVSCIAMMLALATPPLLVFGMELATGVDPVSPHAWRKLYAAYHTLFSVLRAISLTLPYLFVLTMSLFVLSVRQPWSSLRRWVRRPGAVACVAASFALVVTAVVALTWGLSPAVAWGLIPFPRAQPIPEFLGWWGTFMPEAPAYSIIGAWTALILTGQWRPQPTWIDRAGRLLGLGWIALFVGEFLVI
jgi:hypothetical protein